MILKISLYKGFDWEIGNGHLQNVFNTDSNVDIVMLELELQLPVHICTVTYYVSLFHSCQIISVLFYSFMFNTWPVNAMVADCCLYWYSVHFLLLTLNCESALLCSENRMTGCKSLCARIFLLIWEFCFSASSVPDGIHVPVRIYQWQETEWIPSKSSLWGNS